MGWNGSGGFSFTYNWVNDAANGIPITASRMDTQFNDAVTGFDNCITRDAQGVASALIPFPLGLSTDTLSAYTASGPVTVTYGQLKFPGTQNASSNVNTLDDYEEGTFTITLVPSSGSITLNSSFNTGYYTKIGRQVFISGLASVQSVSSPTGDVALRTLPFALQTAAPYGQAFTLFCNALTGTAQPVAYGVSTATEITCSNMDTGTAFTDLASKVQASTVFYFSGSYMAAT